VARLGGVISADINFASAILLVEFEPGRDPRAEIVRTVEATGHGLQPLDEAAAGEVVPERPWLEQHRAELATGGSGVFALLGALLSWVGVAAWLSNAAFGIAILFGGLLVWRRAVVSLKARMPDMNVLMSIAVFGAVALGEWGEGATVFFLFSLGGLLESRALERTRRSIRDLMELAPPTARVGRHGDVVELPVDEVIIGDSVIVRSGERIPVDGVIARGTTAVDESAITGESLPAEKAEGDKVFAGTLNTNGLIEVAVTAPAHDSTLAQIVFLVEEAQAARAPSQRLVDRFSRYYTPVVIALAVAIAVVPPLLGSLLGLDWGPWGEWVNRALVMLVVSCPCALVLSTPVAIVSGITRASRDGVLVKGGAFLETAARVSTVAFDKTGTLTKGKPHLAAIVAVNGYNEGQVLALAGALEAHSNHPIARAIVHAAAGRAHPGELAEYGEVAGRGVRASVDGVVWELCSPACAAENGALTGGVDAARQALEEQGQTTLVLLSGGRAAGVLGVADEMRPETVSAIEALRDRGLEHLIMLTGDNELVGRSVAERAGLTGVLSQLLPAGKTDAVRELQERYGVVAMVGDGVNDAPALAAADIGIAMGAAGTDTALETADVALMRDDLSALPGFFDLGQRTMRTIIVNVAFSIAVKAVFLVLAVTGYATLWMAVFADTGVSLIVIANGMRLLRSPRAVTGARECDA
jgi:Cd2+/Zn2+-exporting ATPase